MLRKFLNKISLPLILPVAGYLAYLKFNHIDMTETRFAVEFWHIGIIPFVLIGLYHVTKEEDA